MTDITIIRKLHYATIQDARTMLDRLTTEDVKILYVEACDMKKIYPVGYNRLDAELNFRTNKQIEEGFSR